MKKKNVFATISVLSFIISAAFTISLFTSNSVGRLATVIMFASAIVFEMSKWTLLWEGFSGKHASLFSGILITLWAAVTLGSIAASCGYVLNQSNQTQNNAIISSTQYKQAEESRKIQISTYNNKAAEIDQLRQQASELPKNYYSLKQEIMSKVTQKSKDLASLTSEIKKPIEVKAELPTSGYSAFFKLMSKVLDADPTMLELWFFIGLGIVLELIANVFAYLFQKERLIDSNFRLEPKRLETCETTKFQTPKIKKIYQQNSPAVAKIGFNIEPKRNNNHNNKPEPSISTEDYDKYVEYMYDKQKNGYAPGYLDIARNVNIAVETARAIKGELQRRGVIQTVGNRTVILK
jgi:hypothetical protein